ncbi:cellulose biosynthesis cyclic di-GMP-binding regulatory protein BcsB [Sphaerotilus uruguayifluvii]|uniref:Cyclic di-GMP-binding protein n=1 Tax=Sphaerotilus uruguayifluvii TaxID=2735897 RepID=A0ABX2FZA4_9BURK|nr:cellulose biosynthesis cyclic di-GMP-binding regulatory protein BcsB [Leptothrix sp. C29]NRT55366.1 hypothetical protein [Leptothrix sp. C29]
MTMRPFLTLLALAGALMLPAAPLRAGSSRAPAQPAARPASVAPAAPSASAPTIAPNLDIPRGGRRLDLSFDRIGQVFLPQVLRRGHFRQRLYFELRTDELATRAVLQLRFTPSPDMAGRSDLLVVKLNSETVARIDMPAAPLPPQIERTLEIDPRILTDRNELTVQFAAPPDCDPKQTFPRISLDGSSMLTLLLQPLPLANDLAVLPAPFFDRHDTRPTAVTLVTSERPERTTLQSAAHLASWFGALADYRGATVGSRGDLPGSGHAIVLATPADRPADVELPPITGPTVLMGSHPRHPGSKVLYLLGRDGAELRRAVDALVQGQLPGHGSSVVLSGTPPEIAPRQPYDAPRWTPTHRPVRFDELVAPERLGFSGTKRESLALTLPMRLPPDIFPWRNRHIPIEMHVRHSPQVPDPGEERPEHSELDVRVNHEFLYLIDMSASTPRRWFEDLKRRFSGDDLVVRQYDPSLRLAAAQLGTQSHARLDLRADHGPEDEIAECLREARAENSNGGTADPRWSLPSTIIDGSSTVDFSDAPHYLPMPNLAAFANAGYPFSRMADLSESAIVLPDVPVREEVDAMLAVASFIGRSTGLAGRAVEVVRAREVDQVASRELVVIGSAGSQPLFTEWAGAMPFLDLPVAALGDAGARRLQPLTVRWPWLGWLKQLWRKERHPPLHSLTFRHLDARAVLLGFESPLRGGRSVVALIGETPADLALGSSALDDAQRVAQIHGQIVAFDAQGHPSYREADPTYGSGELPWITWLRWQLSDRPVLLWLVLLGSVLLLSLINYVLLQRHAIRRRAGAPA